MISIKIGVFELTVRFFRIPVHAGQSKQQEPILQSDACIFLHAALIGHHCSAQPP